MQTFKNGDKVKFPSDDMRLTVVSCDGIFGNELVTLLEVAGVYHVSELEPVCCTKPVFTVFYSRYTLSWSMTLDTNEWGFCEAPIPCKPTARQVRQFKKGAYKALM